MGSLKGLATILRLSDDAVFVLASPDRVNVQYRDALERSGAQAAALSGYQKAVSGDAAERAQFVFLAGSAAFYPRGGREGCKVLSHHYASCLPNFWGYNPPVEEPGKSLPMPAQPHILDRPAILTPPPAATSPMLQEVFNLDEGPVTLSFPSALTEESYEELKAQLELFLRRAQRRARQRLGEKVIREVLKSKKDEAAN